MTAPKESDPTPSPAEQRRNLLPRWPSDRIVWGLLIGGLVVALVVGVEFWLGLIPGAVAGAVQHVGGHVTAWRRGGVERAFVMESSAISFYVVVLLLVAAAGIEAADLVDIGTHWLAIAALYVDTIVRSIREHRFA